MTEQQRVTTADLMIRLRRHYLKPGPMPGGVFIPEVGVNGTMSGTTTHSGGKVRRCDALYVGFTSTSGRMLIGHEVKVSRADWLHELAQPHKASQWADQCHAWFVVAGPDVVKPEELPPGWGLMLPGQSKTRMDVKVRPTYHDDRAPDWWAVRSMLARMDTLMEGQITARTQASMDARAAEVEARIERQHRAGLGSRDALADRIVTELRGAAGPGLFVGDDELIAALRVLLANRDAAAEVRRRVTLTLRSLSEALDPLRHAYGPLAELAKQLDKENPTA